VFAITQSAMRGVPVLLFNSKPAFVSTLRPGGRGVRVGVTEGVVDVDEVMLLDEVSGVDDVRIEVEGVADVEKVVLVDETSGVVETVMITVLEGAALENEDVGGGATRVS
jgi:hypothetical protein